MKQMYYILVLFLMCMILVEGCKKGDSGPVDEATDWDFTATITLNDQWNTTYVAEGNARYERTGEKFRVIVNYNIGQAVYRNIELGGSVSNDQVEFDPNTVIIDFEIGGNPVSEEITFTLDPVIVAGSSASGSGFLEQRLLPDGIMETGTFVFNASKQ